MTTRIPLADGRSIPQVGVGTYKLPAERTAELVAGAIGLGARHIDTAKLYGNEREVGEGIRSSGVPRDEVFVTTKLWDDDHGYDATRRALEASLGRLGMDRVDLYLIHWPCPRQDRYLDSWRAMIRARDEGLVSSIGVSNFTAAHLRRLLDETGESPVVNQIELHPRFPQWEQQRIHEGLGVVTESWAPLARGGLLADPVLRELAAKHGRTSAQVVLRWHLDRGLVVFPKSSSLDRVRENLDLDGVALDDADRATIATLETGERTGMDPDAHG